MPCVHRKGVVHTERLVYMDPLKFRKSKCQLSNIHFNTHIHTDQDTVSAYTQRECCVYTEGLCIYRGNAVYTQRECCVYTERLCIYREAGLYGPLKV